MSIKLLVRPENIKTNDHFWDTFGNSETEVSARWIVNFLRARNFCLLGDKGWDTFPSADLENFYRHIRQKPSETFYFNELNRHIQYENGMVTVLDSFVCRIASNPKLISADRLVCESKYSFAYESACMK